MSKEKTNLLVTFHMQPRRKEELVKYANITETPVSAFIRQAIKEKIERMRRECNTQ